MNTKKQYKVGDLVCQNYRITKAKKLDELQATLYEAIHQASGAKIMQIANDDRENLFCLNFMTLPASDNGVAHILEHTVLCGSEKFPVKDPFFYMTRRSLNTFMNAMTGSDFTCYPAASQIKQDFYNLLDVYLDAVFHPLLKELSFLQEGHRLEFKDPMDISTDLTYQGIVYNEMKGSLSSADSRLWHAILKHLMPDLPYRFNSGGDPVAIPDLTYEEFLNFHKTYYDPSKCLFFFYGDIALEEHLAFLDEKLLKNIKNAPEPSQIGLQNRFESPKEFIGSYPLTSDDPSNKTYISFSWLTTDIKNQEDVLALQLLDSILMDTDASPLKLAIMKSNLCRAADGFIDVEFSEVPYVIICRGTESKNLSSLKKIIFETLESIASTGFDKSVIESSLHQLEFHRLEITGDGSPFGLSLFFRAALPSMHGCPAENALIVHELFETLLKRLEDPTYLPSILRKYFIENSHFVSYVMEPSSSLIDEEKNEELEKLKEIKSTLSDKDAKKIVEKTSELFEFQKQDSEDNADSLPKIKLQDVPSEGVEYELTCRETNCINVYHHDTFTNHIIYADIVIDLPKLTLDELFLTKLLTYLAPDLGVNDLSYIDQQNRLQNDVGSLHFALATHAQFSNPDELKPALHLKGKSLTRKVSALFEIFNDLLTSLRLDEKERIKELVLQLHTHMQNRLTKSSMSYAVDFSLSQNSKATKLNHLWHGLPYYKFIEDLAKNIDQKIDTLCQDLNALKQKLFHGETFDLVLCSSKEDFQAIEEKNFFDLRLPKQDLCKPWDFDIDPQNFKSHARSIDAPVAFTSKAIKLITAPHEDIAYLSLASSLFDNKVLHKQIREKGGAYGSGSSYSAVSGNFYMYSYRDPNLASTLSAFDEAIISISKGEFSDEDLVEAKLSIIQSIDSPISPGSKASVGYSRIKEHRDATYRQTFRTSLLNATKKDVQDAVLKHLHDFSKSATVVTFAGKDLLDKELNNATINLPILEI